jgi:hypothetical protein
LDDLKVDIFEDRICIFSPKGGKFDLPRGASAIDFAYAIHTKLGNKAVKAEINDNVMPITSTLKNGDVVKIITSPNARPCFSWLAFVKTNFAKIKIQKYLKKIDRKEKIKTGRKILQKEFDIAGLGFINNINFKKINTVLSENFARNFKDFDDLFIAIAEGEIKPVKVVKLLKKPIKTDLPGIKIYVKILAKNRLRLLHDVSEIFYKYSLDLISFKAWASNKTQNSVFYIKCIVGDLEQIGHIFDELEQMEDIKQVYRISYTKLYFLYFSLILTGLIWLVHPFILNAGHRFGFIVPNSFLSDLILYSGLFSLFIMVICLTIIIKNHIPYIRNRKPFWMAVFGIPILGVAFLFLEVSYLGITKNWIIILLELIILYFYLIKSFWEIKKSS